MAGGPFSTGPVHRIIHNVVRDTDGSEVLRTTAQTVMITHGDGKVEHHQLFENVLLADGTNWNASMLDKPEGQLGVCACCREPTYRFPMRSQPTHGLIRLAYAKICVECGQLTCSKHRKLGSDGKWRCIRCAPRAKARGLLSAIFFAEE